jgi:fermentation-respiration switch protein FrsA (DUF1100 family)
MIKAAVLAAALAYAGVVAILWFAQEKLLFFPQPAGAPPGPPAGWSLEKVQIRAADGTSLVGVLLKPPVDKSPVVIYFGGNAEEVTAYAGEVAARYGPRAVLLVNYRGYGASGGKPGEKSLVADALAIYDWVAKRGDVDATRIALHGRSLGSGVAVQLAAARPVRCMILTSAYDSLVAVARSHYPWAPVGWLLRNRFESIALAKSLSVPALMLIGEEDDIVAPEHSERLAAAWGGTVERIRLAGRGHNDLDLDARYAAAISAFLDRHL